ncbi:GNAT family N-acetyltransferase [Jiangella rhizosphaerae]|uniref:N-acetyltransferase n=1 Tax=Jiangella rhizosphaerae TaxID=2293569 RepID=A0A418KR53_9ACTN|nr:N-acetyltransferase [Jiangella rhizosphaerae]RIQ23911.1 N-acetyltransferase [Jiangella rhizosphaerae]
MELRPERSADHDAVHEVHRQAFGADGEHVAALTDDLRGLLSPTSGLSLVAVEDGDVVGHVLFTRGILDAPERLVDVLVLSPVGVLPTHQKQGVGSALVTRGLELADEQGAPAVFLEGAPGYYPRFGFEPGEPLGFRKPSLRIPDAAFQVRALGAYEPWMTGTLVYSEIFWRHDAVGLR